MTKFVVLCPPCPGRLRVPAKFRADIFVGDDKKMTGN